MAEDKEVKRLNYFKGQFLQEEDFNAEQAYHIRMRRLHNRALHTWGVVEGLVVSQIASTNSVVVAPGIAIDKMGQEIVLPLPGSQSIPISGVTKGEVFITISYDEADDPADKYTTAGVEGKFKKKTERPLLPKPEAAPPADGSLAILLAKLSVDNGNVVGIDNDVRRLANSSVFASSDLEVKSLKWGNNSRLQADQGGSIELGGDNKTGGTGTPHIDFHFRGKPPEDFNARIINDADGRLSIQAAVLLATGSVGIGTPTPGAKLTVQQGATSTVAAAKEKGLFVSALMGSGSASDGGIEFRHDNLTQGIGFGYNTIYATGSNPNQDLSLQSRGAGSLLLNPSAGNVGIGTASPVTKLDAAGTIRATAQTVPSGGEGLEVIYAGNRGFLTSFNRSPGGGYRPLNINGSVLLLNADSGGSVGVGPGTPTARLQVFGGAIMPAAGNNAQSGIQFPSDPGSGSGDEAFIRYFAVSGETTKLMIGVGNDADDTIGFTQLGAERMTISNGNVGIGTTTPAETLDVNGRIKSGALSIGPWPANAGYMFVGTSALDQSAAGNYALLQGAAADKGITFLNSPENIRFRIGNSDRMILTKDGNVGIGTNSPDRPLGIRAKGPAEELIGFENPSAVVKWHINQNLGGKPGLNFAETGVADGRFFIQAGGNVGIGTVDPKAKLEVAGSIRSSMWNVAQVFNEKQGGLPLSETFNSGGGTLLIFASGSGWRATGGGIGMAIQIDGAEKGTAIGFTNEPNSHKTFVANALVVPGVAAGQHTLKLIVAPDFPTNTDVNDRFSVTILELPWVTLTGRIPIVVGPPIVVDPRIIVPPIA
jgi:hypothetical protein